MGTRSFIAIKTDDGFKGSYCHWDGYLEHNGKILAENYSDYKKAKALVEMGSMSSLRENIGEKHNFDYKTGTAEEKRIEDGKFTTFYHRDRGKDLDVQTASKLEDLIKTAEEYGTEFFYLHDGQNWRYAERGMQMFGMSDGSSYSDLKLLSEGLAELKKTDAA